MIVVATTANRRTWTTICRGSDGWVMGKVVWTDYLRHRAHLREFEPAAVERIVLYSEERYFDISSQRMVAVGRSDSRLVVIPYEQEGENFTPVTIHATTRQQINFRLKTGRFKP